MYTHQLSGLASQWTRYVIVEASYYSSFKARFVPFWETDNSQAGSQSIVNDMQYIMTHVPMSMNIKRLVLYVLGRHF